MARIVENKNNRIVRLFWALVLVVSCIISFSACSLFKNEDEELIESLNTAITSELNAQDKQVESVDVLFYTVSKGYPEELYDLTIWGISTVESGEKINRFYVEYDIEKTIYEEIVVYCEENDIYRIEDLTIIDKLIQVISSVNPKHINYDMDIY